jgi:hypothetical protein
LLEGTFEDFSSQPSVADAVIDDERGMAHVDGAEEDEDEEKEEDEFFRAEVE